MLNPHSKHTVYAMNAINCHTRVFGALQYPLPDCEIIRGGLVFEWHSLHGLWCEQLEFRLVQTNWGYQFALKMGAVEKIS